MNSPKQATLTTTAVLVLLLVSGCSSSPQMSDEPQTLDLARLMENTSDFQREIIEDGVVTEAEFERALLARRDCVAAAGATPGEIYENENGEPTFDFDITAPTQAELEDIQSEADACLGEYFEDVGSLWAYQRLLSPEEREEQRPVAIECLEAAGVEGLSENSSVQDMIAATTDDEDISEAERACIVEYSGLFATWTNEANEPHGREDEPHDHE